MELSNSDTASLDYSSAADGVRDSGAGADGIHARTRRAHFVSALHFDRYGLGCAFDAARHVRYEYGGHVEAWPLE
jgi:hypothetical protein